MAGRPTNAERDAKKAAIEKAQAEAEKAQAASGAAPATPSPNAAPPPDDGRSNQPARRGRPPGGGDGAKRGRKAKAAMPPPPREFLDEVALAPLHAVSGLAKLVTRDPDGKVPALDISGAADPAKKKMVQDQFAAWVESKGWQISPGWGFILASMYMIGAAAPAAIDDRERKILALQNAGGLRAVPTPPAEPVPPTPAAVVTTDANKTPN